MHIAHHLPSLRVDSDVFCMALCHLVGRWWVVIVLCEFGAVLLSNFLPGTAVPYMTSLYTLF